MQIVKMESAGDCGAACLAMALGMRRASDVYPLLGYDPSKMTPMGVTDGETMEALRLMGRRSYIQTAKEAYAASWGVEIESLHARCKMSYRGALQAKLGSQQTGCAIVVVPSLNMENTEHYVFCRKGEVYDPSNGKKYIGTANSLPLSAVIFIEDYMGEVPTFAEVE